MVESFGQSAPQHMVSYSVAFTIHRRQKQCQRRELERRLYSVVTNKLESGKSEHIVVQLCFIEHKHTEGNLLLLVQFELSWGTGGMAEKRTTGAVKEFMHID